LNRVGRLRGTSWASDRLKFRGGINPANSTRDWRDPRKPAAFLDPFGRAPQKPGSGRVRADHKLAGTCFAADFGCPPKPLRFSPNHGGTATPRDRESHEARPSSKGAGTCSGRGGGNPKGQRGLRSSGGPQRGCAGWGERFHTWIPPDNLR